MRELMLRMQLDNQLDAEPGSSLFGVSHCAEVPFYGSLLLTVTDLCNPSGDLVASGTYQASGLPSSPATAPPSGLRVTSMALTRPSATTAGALRATFGLVAVLTAERRLTSSRSS